MSLRIGLIAASRIALTALIEPAREVEGVEVTAVAARDLDRAEEAARRWRVPRAFGSYAELIASGEVDAVYVGTPAAHHRVWTLAALEAGLHVLCEKPFASNSDDARLVAEAASRTDLVVMEAFHWCYHPLATQMRSVLDDLGPVERIEAWFDLPVGHIPRSDIRWRLELGGGSTMDLGCYPIHWSRWLVGSEPTVVSARAEIPVTDVDGALWAELAWPDGPTGAIRSSMIARPGEDGVGLVVHARGGTMTVENPLAPQRGSTLTVDRGGTTEHHAVDRSATYLHQLVAFKAAVLDGTPFPTTAADAVLTMSVIDACYRAAGLAPRPSFTTT